MHAGEIRTGVLGKLLELTHGNVARAVRVASKEHRDLTLRQGREFCWQDIRSASHLSTDSCLAVMNSLLTACLADHAWELPFWAARDTADELLSNWSTLYTSLIGVIWRVPHVIVSSNRPISAMLVTWAWIWR